MESLGRVLNPVAVAKGVYVSLKDAVGVGFLCFLAGGVGDTYTLTEAKSAAGAGAQVLATVRRYWTSNGVGGVWTLHELAAASASASTVVTAATAAENGAYIHVDGIELSDGYSYLKLASTGAGLTTAFLVDLKVQRKPSNLPSVIV